MLKTIESILLRRTGFCAETGLLDHPPFWVCGTSVLSSSHIMFQIHPPWRIKPCIWTIPLTEIALLVLHIAYLLANLIISVVKSAHWGKLDYPYCCKECTLMQTWYWLSIQDSFCIQMRYSKFHCSLLITSFHLSELLSMWIPCWFFRSGVSWWATLMSGNNATPKAQRKKQKKRQKQQDKHTSIQII